MIEDNRLFCMAPCGVEQLIEEHNIATPNV